jgi:hypothetical protein
MPFEGHVRICGSPGRVTPRATRPMGLWAGNPQGDPAHGPFETRSDLAPRKLGKGGRLYLKPFAETLRVESRPAELGPAAGSESCVGRGDPHREA